MKIFLERNKKKVNFKESARSWEWGGEWIEERREGWCRENWEG